MNAVSFERPSPASPGSTLDRDDPPRFAAPSRFRKIPWMAWAVSAFTAGQFALTACTTFVLANANTVLFARNLDWHWSDGFLTVNPRSISKTAFVLPPDRPVRWISKYGSVTFNQFCREMPLGGMNEKGLVIENMMLPESQYAPHDERPAINLVQWIQYHLDTCATVEEVIACSLDVRIEKPFANASIHYLVADVSGAAATFEMLDGKLVCHSRADLPIKALANSTYESSLGFANTFEGLGGTNPLPSGSKSLSRFIRAAGCAATFKSQSPAADRQFAFAGLSEVAQQDFTVWSIVYDPVARRIDYQTRDHPGIRWIALDDFDFSPVADPLHLDIHAGAPGNVRSEFRVLTPDHQRDLLKAFVGRSDVRDIIGDLTPMVEPILALLATYQPVD